jgi:hypothetical protein
MANMQKIDEVMAIIEAEYAKGVNGEFCAWDQGSWARKTSCGTSYCFAGWRVHLDGGVVVFEDYSDTSDEFIFPGNSKIMDIYEYAKEQFDLSEKDAVRLFDYCNSIRQLRQKVEHLRVNGSLHDYDMD